MTRFEYSYMDVSFFDSNRTAGFHIAIGDEWKDIEFNYLKRDGSLGKSSLIQVDKKWLKRFCKMIEEQVQIKPISSWVYKTTPHTSEHIFKIECEEWNREIGIYNLGSNKNHFNKAYAEEEKLLIDLFEKVKEMLLEVNCDLSMVSFKTI